jgi:hypothetical protein
MLILLKKDERLVNNFTIYGERHSGTNLLENVVKGSLGLEVTWEFGWKHFFGFVHYQQIVQAENTLFFCIARNPYDWIMAMSKQPYHIPKDNEKPIKNLLLNEWYSIDDYRKEIKEDRHYLIGQKYKNIFEMRKNKLEYMINYMPRLCNNLCVTTYEHLTDNTLASVRMISKYFNLKLKEKDLPLIWPRRNYDISPDIKQVIDSNIDWDLESFFGYDKKRYSASRD